MQHIVDGNVAFKVTWLYGTKGAFQGLCNADGRKWNTRHASWCSQRDCLCRKLDRKNDDRELQSDDFPCDESIMFNNPWRFGAGLYTIGKKQDEPIPFRQAKEGKFAFFTSKNNEMSEEQRIVLAAYKIDSIRDSDIEGWGGYVAIAQQRNRFRVRKLKFAPKFWRFYQNCSGPPAWGSGLFRYLSDEQATKLYRAVQEATRRP